MIRSILLATLAASLCLGAERTPDARLRNATSALREIMGSPDKGIPEELMENAQCVVVVPDLLKAAFIVGGKYGRGYATCRVGDHWSAPGAVRIEGGSFGFQLGGSATDLVMLVMNRRGVEHLLSDKFTLGGDASAGGGPVGRHISAQTDVAMHAEILTWSRSRGLFAGISLEGATLRPDSSENRKLYGTDVSQRAILDGGVSTPGGGRPFVALVARIARSDEYKTAENRPAVRTRGDARHDDTYESLQRPGGRMTFGEREVRFATGQAAINGGAERPLNNLAKTLKDHPGWTIRIEGYTDNTGRRDANRQLSQQRAEAVMNWLADHGVDRNRMTAKGYGASRPAADNETSEGRAQNRRVEIVRTESRVPTGE